MVKRQIRRHRRWRARWWGFRLIPVEAWTGIVIIVIVLVATIVYELETR